MRIFRGLIALLYTKNLTPKAKLWASLFLIVGLRKFFITLYIEVDYFSKKIYYIINYIEGFRRDTFVDSFDENC